MPSSTALQQNNLANRPIRDRRVDLFHQRHRPPQGNDDALVVGQVVVAQLPAAAVFQPFVQHLITADVEGPHVLRHAIEVLRLVDMDAPGRLALDAGVLRIPLLHAVVAGHGVAGDGGGHIRRFQQVQGHQLPPQRAGGPKQRRVAGQRHAGEVDLQEFGVALAVGRAVEDGVDVVEDVFGAELARLDRPLNGLEAQGEFGFEGGDEGGGEVGGAVVVGGVKRPIRRPLDCVILWRP